MSSLYQFLPLFCRADNESSSNESALHRFFNTNSFSTHAHHNIHTLWNHHQHYPIRTVSRLHNAPSQLHNQNPLLRLRQTNVFTAVITNVAFFVAVNQHNWHHLRSRLQTPHYYPQPTTNWHIFRILIRSFTSQVTAPLAPAHAIRSCALILNAVITDMYTVWPVEDSPKISERTKCAVPNVAVWDLRRYSFTMVYELYNPPMKNVAVPERFHLELVHIVVLTADLRTKCVGHDGPGDMQKPSVKRYSIQVSNPYLYSVYQRLQSYAH